MSSYDAAGNELFWGYDEKTSLGARVPGPASVWHVFRAEVSRRRATTLCGREMLTYSVPAEIDDIRFDSYRVPVCRDCAEASDTAQVLKLVKARFARRGS